MKKLILIASLVLAGCATTANYEAKLNRMVGMSELELVRAWGPPVSSYQTGQSKFLVFKSARSIYIPGTPTTYTTSMVGNSVYTTVNNGTPAQNIAVGCTTTFELLEDRIYSWRWQGDDCKAKED